MDGWRDRIGNAEVEQGLYVIRGYIKEHWEEKWTPLAGNLGPEEVRGGKSFRL